MQGAIEEKIQERAFKKLFLDAVVIQQGRLVEKMKGASREELLDMIRFGAEEVVRLTDENLDDFDVDELLLSAEQKTEQDRAKIKEMTEKSFSANFSMDGGVPSSTDTFTFDGKDYKDRDTKKNDGYFLDFGARERKLKSSLNVDASFREQMMQAQVVPKKSTGPRVPKYLQLPQYFEYQFFNVKRLMDINEKKKRAWQTSIDQVSPFCSSHMLLYTVYSLYSLQGIEQDFNDEYGLEPHEIAEERALKAEGFDWTRRDFMGFRGACERHGRHNHKAIAEDLEKSLEEVKRYSSVFWSRIEEVPDHKRIVSLIEKGESKIQKRQEAMDAVGKKVSKYAMPWQQMRFQYGQLKGKVYWQFHSYFPPFYDAICRHGLRTKIVLSYACHIDWVTVDGKNSSGKSASLGTSDLTGSSNPANPQSLRLASRPSFVSFKRNLKAKSSLRRPKRGLPLQPQKKQMRRKCQRRRQRNN